MYHVESIMHLIKSDCNQTAVELRLFGLINVKGGPDKQISG